MNELKKLTRYEIRQGEHKPCELWSVALTNFGGDAENFVCEGTYTYCQRVKDSLRAAEGGEQ